MQTTLIWGEKSEARGKVVLKWKEEKKLRMYLVLHEYGEIFVNFFPFSNWEKQTNEFEFFEFRRQKLIIPSRGNL